MPRLLPIAPRSLQIPARDPGDNYLYCWEVKVHAGGLVTQGLWELRTCSPSPRPHLLPDIFLAPNAGSLPPRPMRTSEQAVVLLQGRALPPRTCSLVERPRTILKAELCGLVRLGVGLRGLGTACLRDLGLECGYHSGPL